MLGRRIATCLITVAIWSPSAVAGEDCPELLAAAKTATGGAALDGVVQLQMEAAVSTSGLEGTLEAWEDLTRGRSVTRVDLGVVAVAEGFDGATPWSQDPSGDVTEQGSEENLRSARNQGYLTARAMWYPKRWAAEIGPCRTRQLDGRPFDVIEIVPQGGRRLEIWLDADTRQMAKIVDVEANVPSTIFLSDYREVEGLFLPHRIRSSNGETKYDTVVRVNSVTVNPELPEGAFDIPTVAIDDFIIADDGVSTTIPFDLHNNHIYVQARVNGGAPKRFLVDTGGVNLLTEAAAARLGVGSNGRIQGRGVGEETVDIGVARLSSFTFGAITMREPSFYVIPLEEGNIGGGVLKRFTVIFDYGNKLMILEPNANFAEPEPYDRSGMWIQRRGDSLEVLDVVPGGAADDAGIEVGDRIDSIGGVPAPEVDLPGIREEFRRRPPGTVFQLILESDGDGRTARLVLKDLLAVDSETETP